ncbi:MAG: preprotein translocase subunit SecG [Ignavibacteriales bacterium]|nr:preprotein translocase subunit SecG [Ignavibacteriales bacterium]MBI5727061.1 preprotein translocase subunit SecG [Ignavibacteriales bacterium]
MFPFLIVLSAIIAVLLIIVVLLQASKGNGLAGTFGGAAQMGAVFGTRRTADFLSKATWALSASLVVLALVINLFFLKVDNQSAESIIQKNKSSVPTAPSLPPTGK